MIEAMTEAELYAPVEWRTAPPVTKTSSITSPGMALPRSPSTAPRCATPSPRTVKEMLQALADARYDDRVGTIILTGFRRAGVLRRR